MVFWDAKVRVDGDRFSEGTAPVPFSVTVPTPLTVRVAVRAPVAAGLNVTLMVQFAPAATLVPQVPPGVPVGRANSVVENVMLMGCANAPGLLTVTG